MNPDRIAQAQLAYQHLLELNIQHEESVLNFMKYPDNHELRNIKLELAEKLKHWEEQFTKEYADVIQKGVTFPRNLYTNNATQSL